MKNLSMIAWWLMVIGSINWGLTAFGMNVVNMLLGTLGPVEMIVYILVGLAGVYSLLKHFEVL